MWPFAAFVRSHLDLDMSHVAAYYKSYQRAANDVLILIETPGVCVCILECCLVCCCAMFLHVHLLGLLLSGKPVVFDNGFFISPLLSFAFDSTRPHANIIVFLFSLISRSGIHHS